MIEIVPYDPAWPALFAGLRAQLSTPLAGLATRIEHVGSTAVPGLAAKPVIDLVVVAPDVPAVIGCLDPLGYRCQDDLGIPGRSAFTPPVGLPPHHLYACRPDHPTLRSALAFRDHLRTHPGTARAYAELKYFLAARFRDDRVGYTAAKSAFITRVVAAITDT